MLVRWWHHLRYFAADAREAFKDSPGVHVLATGTLAVVLFLAGILALVLVNADGALRDRLRDVRVEIYLEGEVDNPRRQGLERRLNANPAVESIAFVDSDEALERFAEWDADGAQLLSELDGRRLPASFEVVLRPDPSATAAAEALVTEWSAEPGVSDVRFDREWLSRLSDLLITARWSGGGVAAVVLTALLFVITSVLRLSVYARRDEIDIMMLIGARPSFVRGPFIVSGLCQGVVASVLALAGVELGRRLVIGQLGQQAAMVVDWLASRPLTPPAAAAIVAVGLVVSGLAGAFAVRRRP